MRQLRTLYDLRYYARRRGYRFSELPLNLEKWEGGRNRPKFL